MRVVSAPATQTTRPGKERQRQPLLHRVRRLLTSPSAQIAAYVVALSVSAAAVWGFAASSFPQLDAPIGIGWPILAILFFGAERFVVDIDVREQTHSFSLSEIAVILAIIFASPVDLLLGQ